MFLNYIDSYSTLTAFHPRTLTHTHTHAHTNFLYIILLIVNANPIASETMSADIHVISNGGSSTHFILGQHTQRKQIHSNYYMSVTFLKRLLQLFLRKPLDLPFDHLIDAV